MHKQNLRHNAYGNINENVKIMVAIGKKETPFNFALVTYTS